MKYLLVLVCFLYYNTAFSQTTIPNITLNTLNGKSVKIQDEISKDKITILSFWASWCVPCINELDAISEVYEDWQEDFNMELIAISTDDARTQKRIRPMVNGKGWPYKILLDKNQELKRALNISTIPQIIILKDSKIIYIHSGYSPGVEDEFYDIIKENSN
jgi:thiol-disulfide isomerase/thioredoxin|tara:strand:+ start:332 stop:814 length:483 start_codon:yes stop_codon:yes gene_type:complete